MSQARCSLNRTSTLSMSPKPKEIVERGLDGKLAHGRDTVGEARGILEVLYALKVRGR